MSTAATTATEILQQVTTAEQLDALHTSLIQLLDTVQAGEIDLFLEQPDKSDRQKILYLQKVIDSLPSPLLAKSLKGALEATGTIFFSRRNLNDWIINLQKQAEKIVVIKMTTAIPFRPFDIREMISLLSERVGQPVVLDITVDSSLIGGAVIQYGTYISDYSLKTKLSQFRASWRRAAIAGNGKR